MVSVLLLCEKTSRTYVVLILRQTQTKRKKGRINLKGESTITPAKSQGNETCVVGGRKPQKERKAENNAYAKFPRDNKEYYGIFEKGLLNGYSTRVKHAREERLF